MKKFLSMVLLAVGLMGATVETEAQGIASDVAAINSFKKLNGTRTVDTVVDGTNDTMAIRIPYSSYGMMVQANLLKVSGTASVKVVLYSTIDGKNYLPHFKTIDASKASLDTFTVTNVSALQSWMYAIDPTHHRTGFMLVGYGTGTQKTAMQGVLQFLR